MNSQPQPTASLLAFSADHAAPAHPRVIEATFFTSSVGYEPGYGGDTYTKQAEAIFQATFGAQAKAYIVTGGGTAANALALQAMMRPFDAIICAQDAHMNTHEAGAAEFFTRAHLLAVPTRDGKLRADQLAAELYRLENPHYSQSRVVSLSQPTERGTLYHVEEIRSLLEVAHQHGLLVHMDGARIFHAAAALETDLRTFTTDVGVDVLSIGLGKNGGLGFGDAVAFLNPALAAGFAYRRRQADQAISKMRYLAPQWLVMLENDFGIALAAHANAMMRRLARQVADLPVIHITNEPIETNCLLAILEPEHLEPLGKKYSMTCRGGPQKNEVRLMTSYATTGSELDQLVQDIKHL
jgi:threonine aldolase